MDYKIEPKARVEFSSLEQVVGADVFHTIGVIYRLSSEITDLIALRNKLLKQREGIASAAHEYLRSNLTELKNPDDNRKLLMVGVESSLDAVEEQIRNRRSDLFQIDRIYREHFKHTVRGDR